MSTSGGLSNEEFLVLQEQLIALRNKNYELQELLQKKNSEIAQLSTPKSEALQFANKLINRRDKEREIIQKYEAELDALRRKLLTQEEEFRLQQETLISELNKVVVQNETTRRELEQLTATNSIYSSPQAGTPCETHLSLVEDGMGEKNVQELQMGVSLVPSLHESAQSGGHTERVDKGQQVEMNSDDPEKDLFIRALEDELLEYQEKANELKNNVESLSMEKTRLQAALKESEAELFSMSEDLRQSTSQRDDFVFRTWAFVSKVAEMFAMERACLSNQGCSTEVLDREVSRVLERISSYQAEFNEEACNKKVESLMMTLEALREAHAAEIQSLKEESEVKADELKHHLVALETSNDKVLEERVLLLETRYQLELADREKSFAAEREDMQRKICSLETSLSAKDEDKVLSLKKQAALIKELQRAVKEEKRRAESMEKLNSCCSEKGWHLVGETDAKSAQTLDGVDSRSVSSSSALESDNVELINRLMSLQRSHAEALDRISALEETNARLSREVSEKTELIEHWIRRRPLSHGSGIAASPRSEGSLRKFLASTLAGDEAVNDIRDMNKKLQRMLEETLSKNIILQRDLQTLLERTEM